MDLLGIYRDRDRIGTDLGSEYRTGHSLGAYPSLSRRHQAPSEVPDSAPGMTWRLRKVFCLRIPFASGQRKGACVYPPIKMRGPSDRRHPPRSANTATSPDDNVLSGNVKALEERNPSQSAFAHRSEDGRWRPGKTGTLQMVGLRCIGCNILPHGQTGFSRRPFPPPLLNFGIIILIHCSSVLAEPPDSILSISPRSSHRPAPSPTLFSLRS